MMTKAVKIQYLLTGEITVYLVYSWSVVAPIWCCVVCVWSEFCGVAVGVLSS